MFIVRRIAWQQRRDHRDRLVNDAPSLSGIRDGRWPLSRMNEGLSSEEALRRAKVAYVNHPRYSHPFYWSSFVMLGDGTRVLVGEPVAEPWGLNLLAAALALGALGIVAHRARRRQ